MKRAFLVLLGVLVAILAWSRTHEVVVADTIPEQETEPKIIYYQNEDRDDRRTFTNRDRSGGRTRIKTLSGSMQHSGGFGAVSFKSTSYRDAAMVFVGGRGGWIINRTLAIGAEGYGIIPTSKYEDIVPDTEVLALGGYGGMFLELIFFSNQVVHVTFPVAAGAGWVGYEGTVETSGPGFSFSENSIIDDDVFWYVEPGADVEVNVARNFRLVFGVSRRYTQDFDLIETDGQALQKLNFFLTLKIGSF